MPSPVAGSPLLRLPAVRRLVAAMVLGSGAMVGEQVVLGWLVLELSDSPLLVGVALAMRMAPLLLAGLPAGMLADRGDRLTLLRGAGLVMAGAAAGVGVLSLSGAITLGPVLALTFLGGCARAVHTAARQSHVHDVSGPDRLVDGLALVGLTMQVGGLAGSLASGALLARLGPGAAYLLVAAGHAGSALAFRRGGALPAAAAPAPPAGAGAGGLLAAARRQPALPLLLALAAAAEALGFSHQTVLPSLARDVLRVGPEGLGAMTGARQLGGILGIAGVRRLRQARGPGALYLAVLGVFGTGVALLGLAPGYAGTLLLLVAVNAAGAIADVLVQTLIQLSVPADVRGRAGGAWVVSIGLGPVGQLQIGAVASWLGPAAALAASGAALVVVVATAAARAPRLRRL
jgi:hypothetical protein